MIYAQKYAQLNYDIYIWSQLVFAISRELNSPAINCASVLFKVDRLMVNFVYRTVRNNFRVCLITADGGQNFQRRCREYPAFTKNVNFLWFPHWSKIQLVDHVLHLLGGLLHKKQERYYSFIYYLFILYDSKYF